MPTINQLPSIDEVSGGNQIPTYYAGGGDARKMSVNLLQDYLQDNLDFPDNASEVTYNPAGASAVARTVESKLRDVVSVKDFGAVGNGVADDTAAIQAALNASDFVYMPPGTYLTSSTITLEDKTLFGGNRLTTIIKPSAAVSTCITLNSNATIYGLTIDGTNTTNATGVLFGAIFSNVAIARDVVIKSFLGTTGYGVKVYYMVLGVLDNVRSEANNKGLYASNPPALASFSTFMTFDNCQFINSVTHGAYIINGYGFTFNNCQFEFNGAEGVYIPAVNVVERVNFNNCWFEKNFESSAAAYQARFDGSAAGATLSYVNIESCYFYNGVSKAAIFIKSQATTFKSNQIPPNSGTVLFNTNSYGWILSQENEQYITDTTGFMQRFSPYVEGTFTPTIDGATTPGSGTYTTQVGVYTKVGNLVNVSVSLTWSAHTGTGPIKIGNLPFVAKSAGGNPAASVLVDGVALTAGNYAAAYVIDGQASAYLIQCPTGGGAIATVPMDTAGAIQFSATYRI